MEADKRQHTYTRAQYESLEKQLQDAAEQLSVMADAVVRSLAEKERLEGLLTDMTAVLDVVEADAKESSELEHNYSPAQCRFLEEQVRSAHKHAAHMEKENNRLAGIVVAGMAVLDAEAKAKEERDKGFWKRLFGL